MRLSPRARELLLLLLTALWLDVAHPAPAGWTVQQRAPPDARITLHIGLAPSDHFAGLREAASDIADPRNPRYRQHLRVHELQVLLSADPRSADAVSTWLQDAGVSPSSMRQRGHVVDATMTVHQAERLLQTEYNVYTDGWMDILRSNHYTVPPSVQERIEFVAPTDTFPEPSRHPGRADASRASSKSKRQTESCGAGSVSSPECIRHVYNVTYTPEPNRTTFAVYGTEAAVYNATDLQTYLETYNKEAADARVSYQVVGNAHPASDASAAAGAFETALTTQTFLGLAWPATGIFYNLGGVFGPGNQASQDDSAGRNYTIYDTYDPFVDFLQDMIHNETVPSVVSFSQSWSENQVNEAYARSICTMMQAIGARGVTLIFSSGNNGAQGNQPDQVHLQDIEPKFPASCPYVTSVGGTTNLAEETAATQETIEGFVNKASLIASGGGFSNYFARPDYQHPSAAVYVRDHVPSSYDSISGFNSSGRGIPDVSAFSTSFPTVVNGTTIPVAGTSAAAPVWAAIITLLNDHEISRGRPTLGFLNPWLYSLPPGTLTDIRTGGNNSGQCASPCPLTPTPGFDVAPGWDPVTGLGSPIFNRLVDALDRRNRSALATNSSSGAGPGAVETGAARAVHIPTTPLSTSLLLVALAWMLPW